MSRSGETERLRALAANRGLKLVKSRIRTPGRQDYGRYGLQDAATGKPVFGLARGRKKASAEEIEAYLRADTAGDWRRSLRQRRRRAS